jgi:hypothetical protein
MTNPHFTKGHGRPQGGGQGGLLPLPWLAKYNMFLDFLGKIVCFFCF